MQYVWFIWTLILLGAWAVVYSLLRDRKSRREMLVVSLWTSLLGATEYFFVPRYWLPPSLFDLAQRTRLDIESFLWAFGVGGLAVVLYEALLPVRHAVLPAAERHAPHHRFHVWAVISAPLVFLVLYFSTGLNPIHSAIIGLIVGGLASVYCRPDLTRKMLTGALVFLAFYFVYFKVLVVMYPGYVERVWNLPAISGVLISSVPLEELLFALGLGFLWSSVYEHIAWRRVITA